MCDVPGIAVFCSECMECFPGMASRFFLKPSVTIPVAPIFYWLLLLLLLLLLLFNTAHYISWEFVGSSTCFDAGRPSSLQGYGGYRRSVVGPLSEASRRGVLQVEPM